MILLLRENLDWLETEWFLRAYVCLYTVKLLLIVGTMIAFLVIDIDLYDKAKAKNMHDASSQAISIFFFILTLAGTVTFAVFLLLEAFRTEAVVS